MRVITGQWKGAKLAALPGEATRPTTDRVKESIFNIIQFDIEGRRVLDLFAGNGQLGIEALSRGAAEAVFVDNSAKAAAVIRQNLEKLRVDKARVVNKDAVAFLQTQDRPFSLIFIDAPYHSTYIRKCLAAIADRNLLAEGGLIVCESGIDDSWDEPQGFCGTVYRYGKTRVTIYGMPRLEVTAE